MAKKKVELDSLTTESNQDLTPIAEEKTVIGTFEAEQLQKSGWQLIDCHMTENGKLYKFRKVN